VLNSIFKTWLPPEKLSLFFTKKCNFNCDYCYLGEKTTQTININRFYKAINFFLCLETKRIEITYMGGEPLLELDFVKKTAVQIRKIAKKRNKEIKLLHLMTNGSLLTKKYFELLKKEGITFTVSLDGKSNDSHRKEKNYPHSSSLRKIRKNLSDIPVAECGNSLVFGPDNVSQLFENVLFTANLGFCSIYFLPRLYEKWETKDLKILKLNLKKIADYYVSLFKGEKNSREIFTIPYLEKYLEMKNNKHLFCCDKLNMDWQGDFYRCWSFLSLPDNLRKRYRLDTKNFNESDKIFRENFFIPAVKLFEKLSQENIFKSVFCPVDAYAYAILYKKNPEEAIQNFIKIGKPYKEFFQNIYSRLKNNLLFKKRYRLLSKKEMC